MSLILSSSEQASSSAMMNVGCSSSSHSRTNSFSNTQPHDTHTHIPNTSCFILPEHLDASVASYLEPAEDECITSSSPCRCGTWYFPSLPPSLGGCGHIYRVQPYVCTLHPYPTPCYGVEWTRKIRSSYYILGLCPACKVVPSKLATYQQKIDDLSRPEAIEQALTLLLAAQDFFEEQRQKDALLKKQHGNSPTLTHSPL